MTGNLFQCIAAELNPQTTAFKNGMSILLLIARVFGEICRQT